MRTKILLFLFVGFGLILTSCSTLPAVPGLTRPSKEEAYQIYKYDIYLTKILKGIPLGVLYTVYKNPSSDSYFPKLMQIDRSILIDLMPDEYKQVALGYNGGGTGTMGSDAEIIAKIFLGKPLTKKEWNQIKYSPNIHLNKDGSGWYCIPGTVVVRYGPREPVFPNTVIYSNGIPVHIFWKYKPTPKDIYLGNVEFQQRATVIIFDKYKTVQSVKTAYDCPPRSDELNF